MTFFYNEMKPLVMGGHLYLAMAPLYKVAMGKEIHHVLDDAELEEFKLKHANRKIEITYLKGLGEMSADELKETMMNPETRRLKQLIVEDDRETAMTLNNLMGTAVQPRKDFIALNAVKANISI